MEIYKQQLIETFIVLILYFITYQICAKIIKNTLSKRHFITARGALIRRVLNILFLTISLIFITLIWGVKQSDLTIYLGSALSIVGVAFFAQWSLFSNITSSIIIFFNHPIKINDFIRILEAKDYEICGTIQNIGIFFITLMTENGEEITLPNNIFIQKSIKKEIKRNEA